MKNGSNVLETSITGTVTSDEKYFAFGKQRDSGKVTTDHRFTGQKEDASGLQYFNSRFYDPMIGIFISPDTIVPQPGLASDYNRYLAFRGNPLKFVDPSGHFSEEQLAFLGLNKADYADEVWQLLLALEPGDSISGSGIQSGIVQIGGDVVDGKYVYRLLMRHGTDQYSKGADWLTANGAKLGGAMVGRFMYDGSYCTVWENGAPTQDYLYHSMGQAGMVVGPNTAAMNRATDSVWSSTIGLLVGWIPGAGDALGFGYGTYSAATSFNACPGCEEGDVAMTFAYPDPQDGASSPHVRTVWLRQAGNEQVRDDARDLVIDDTWRSHTLPNPHPGIGGWSNSQ